MSKILYGLSSKNKYKIWKAESDLITTSDGIKIVVTWGYETGKQQTKAIFVTSGKNLGKKNATTIEEQTQVKIDQLYQQQIDKGYAYDKTSINTSLIFKPQLAHKYADKKHLILYNDDLTFKVPYYGQPKLNGIRCFIQKISPTELQFSSRSGKLFKQFPHLIEDFLKVLPLNAIIDGELFNYNVPFEQIASLVNSDSLDYITEDNYQVKDIHFHSYDYIEDPNTNLDTFKIRNEKLQALFKKHTFKSSFYVETVLLNNHDHIKTLFDDYSAKKYEGLMLRSSSGLYKFAYRTSDLLKYKEMLQDEFKILDIYLAENDPTKVQILCENRFNSEEQYNTFNIGSLLGNKEQNYNTYYLNKSKYIGKYLTVDYQCLSNYNVPLFPVGIIIRDGKLVNNVFIPTV